MNKEDKLISLMEEMIQLQKISVKPVFKKLVEEILEKDEKLMVYELTGENSRDQIISKTGVGAGTISSWWIEWFSKGLLEKDRSKYRKVFSLAELGINVPKKFKNALVKQPVEELIEKQEEEIESER